MTTTTRTTIRNAGRLIAARQPFTAGSLTAELRKWAPHTGRMDGEVAMELSEDIAEAREAGQDTYIVFSYGTPIAWSRVGIPTLTVPNDRYSATTSKHQYLVRNAR